MKNLIKKIKIHLSMKKVFESKSSLIGIVLLLGGIYAVIVPTQFLAGYSMHAKKSEYIINHPELLPSAEGLRIMSVGQLTTFVGFTWLTTVQYI
jgi:hypothetical protein